MDSSPNSPPSTNLSLSSMSGGGGDAAFVSPTSSSLGSWPNSPKRPNNRLNTSPKRRQHFSDVDCTLSLGNAATRAAPPENRLSRAGSPVCEQQHQRSQLLGADFGRVTIALPAADRNFNHLQQQPQSQWPKTSPQQVQQRPNHHELSRNAGLRQPEQLSNTASDYYRLNSQHFVPQQPPKFGFLDFNPPVIGGHHQNLFVDFNKQSEVSSGTPRSRCRSLDPQNDPRNVHRVCGHCGTSSTPLWRNGPLGPKSLCNACGIRYKKVRRSPAPANDVLVPGVTSWMQASNFQDFRNTSIPPQKSSLNFLQENRRIPFAREWNEPSPSSSTAVGSSCITWQDGTTTSGPDNSRFDRRSSQPVVLDAEVIRSVDGNHRRSNHDQQSFLRIAL